jgi:hypothetical protein
MKDIKDYEGRYAATKDGHIFSYYLKGFLSLKTDKDGYLGVCLQKDGVKKHFQVHRLVAITYLDNPKELPTINHIDGNKSNNNVDNLEWNSIADNIRHAHLTNLRCHKGSNNQRSKLNDRDIREIRELLRSEKPADVAKIYGVVPGTIYNIASNRSWKHVI